MFYFATKAQTLESLRPVLRLSTIPQSFSFAATRWIDERGAVLAELTGIFPEGYLIVRSSAVGEDAYAESRAGVYESIPFVSAVDGQALAGAIDTVIASYARRKSARSSDDLVLVQPMVDNISMAGVVFTQELQNGAPYYVINYDDISGRHDAVTSGADLTRTLLIHRGYERHMRSSRFSRLIEAVQEIEDVVGLPGIDIEFVVNTAEEVYIVQVRPLAVRRNWNRSTARRVDQALDQTREFVRDRLRPLPNIVGDRSLYSLMSDWNPVEMLGAAPRPLALSLYRHLITDSIWAEARAGMGYRDLSGRSLLIEFNGRPYIDVRESFNSFLPASLPVPIAEKLVNAWLDRLQEHPELHDKVEFEVTLTTHVPGFGRLYGGVLADWGLGSEERGEFEGCLKNLTLNVLAERGQLLEDELAKTIPLQRVGASDCGRNTDCLYQAKQLLTLCREYGTKPFSVLARCAFMAEAVLRALVAGDAILPERAMAFRASVRTVLADFLEDMRRVREGGIGEKEFFDRYGHLRPSSYDILSPRYDQRQNFLSLLETENAVRNEAYEFNLSGEERRAVAALLDAEGYALSPEDLFRFMSRAIAGREEAKFRFTRALSQALEEIALWGEELGLSRDELSFLRLEDLWGFLSSSPMLPWEDLMRSKAWANRENHEICQAICLPYVICGVADVDIVPLHKSRPNFITKGAVRGLALYLTGHENVAELDFKGAIVFIESADPGFDWIFSRPIVGLVTKYGGANSHMAIRCAELRMPAAIGCGEQLFESLKHSREVGLDCATERLSAQRSPQW
ncbi:MAG: pyruvate phosphate dikinase [Candidatus Accumulibacter sp.]|jgi:phosphohistidine swiveling domain-containing protein|nr:pyruvate phosphate dikinase [Accumulibacter sp.]